MKIFNALLLFLFLSFLSSHAQQKFNFNFEVLDKPQHPEGWDLAWNGQNSDYVRLDSVVKKQGKYAVSITAIKKPAYSIAINYSIPERFKGRQLTLVGTIKTESVMDGYAGMWIRVDGGDQQLELEMMEKQDLHGTNDWKEYVVTIPYDEGNATSIHLGALLTGKGKMWVDSIRLYLDEVPIELARKASLPAHEDTLYNSKSLIDTVKISPENVQRLTLLGQVWGFLKYHHPSIADGEYNWDAELFKLLPQVLKASSNTEFSQVIENWVGYLGKVPECKNCGPLNKMTKVFLEPDYGEIFKNDIFSTGLNEKLKAILRNSNNSKNHYVSFEYARNPAFTNEKLYSKNIYPDAGLRLLALYRYWNIIQYFCPNRNLIAENWNTILPKFIPQLILAKDKFEYTETLVKLLSTIHDSHAFVSSSVFTSSLGKYRLPFDAKYVEDKLVVTTLLIDSLNVKQNFRRGDVIEAINGEKVTDLIQKYLPVTSSSNFEVAMRDMPNTYLLRSNEKVFKITVLRNSKQIDVLQQGVENNTINIDHFGAVAGKKSMKLLSPQVGHIAGNAFKRKDLDSIRTMFKNTKGLVIDMRGYPIEELIHTLGSYIGTDNKPFVKFSYGSVSRPGLFQLTAMVKSGRKLKKSYQGKVILLVNSVTQSNAEFVTMAFQTAPNVSVIGSKTAGADGNISAILLPGGFKTWISGIGVFYPDGINAQQTGVKLDLVVKPTIEGIRNGKDELLEKAILMIIGAM